jgi:hypothetical protein
MAFCMVFWVIGPAGVIGPLVNYCTLGEQGGGFKPSYFFYSRDFNYTKAHSTNLFYMPYSGAY